MFPAPKTWVVGDAWGVTEPNTWIRDAMISVRRYQNSVQVIQDFGGVISPGSTWADLGAAHYNLLSSTPDEGYQMTVLLSLQINNPNLTTGATVRVAIFDQVGTNITPPGATPGVGGWCIADGWSHQTYIGNVTYPLGGTNAGFQFKAFVGTGEPAVAASYLACVIFSPLI
jgi:hypothetical protein